MKNILILCAVIAALTLNTFAHSAFFTLSGESVTSNPVFKVRISARISKAEVMPDTETDVIPPDITDVTEQITEVSDTDTEAMPTETAYDEISLPDTNEIESNTETQENTDTDAHTGVLGGEGTLVFDKAKLKIVSVTPCVPGGITVEYGSTEGFCRFMFYSDAEIEGDVPLMDVEFQILTGEGTVSIIVSEGLFSDGNRDTPSENVSFTAVYEIDEKNPPSTFGPQDSAVSPVTSEVYESLHDTDGEEGDLPNNTDASTDDRSSTSPDLTHGDGEKSLLPVVIAVTAITVSAVGAAVILMTKKVKK